MRTRGYGPTLAGSGRCTDYQLEEACVLDEQCSWRNKTAKQRAHCALRPARRVIRKTGSAKQKAAAKRNTWLQALAQARSEGLSGSMARGTPLHTRAKAIQATLKSGQRGGYYW